MTDAATTGIEVEGLVREFKGSVRAVDGIDLRPRLERGARGLVFVQLAAIFRDRLRRDCLRHRIGDWRGKRFCLARHGRRDGQ